MEFSKSILFVVTLMAAPFSFSQIVTKPKQEVAEPVKEPARPKRVATTGTDEFSFYLGADFVRATRDIRRNKAPFGKPLYERDNEKPLNTWAYQIGIRNRVNNYLSYDAAFSIESNGESYSYDDPASDSTYSYETTYQYFSLPIQMYYTYGKDLRFFVGGGIQPSLLNGYRKEINYTTAATNEGKETVTKLEDPENFAFGLLASAGVQLRLGRVSSIYVIPGMMWNLTSTYNDQSEYIHKARNFNIKFGLVFHIPNNRED